MSAPSMSKNMTAVPSATTNVGVPLRIPTAGTEGTTTKPQQRLCRTRRLDGHDTVVASSRGNQIATTGVPDCDGRDPLGIGTQAVHRKPSWGSRRRSQILTRRWRWSSAHLAHGDGTYLSPERHCRLSRASPRQCAFCNPQPHAWCHCLEFGDQQTDGRLRLVSQPGVQLAGQLAGVTGQCDTRSSYCAVHTEHRRRPNLQIDRLQ